MGLWKGTKKVLGLAFNFRVDQWAGLPWIKSNHAFYMSQVRSLFKIQRAQRSEEFEDALSRFTITPEELELQANRYLLLTYLFVMMAIGLLIYAIITALLGNWMGATICVALIIYSLTLAFRYHFWRFQISQKKLGCTIPEWYRSLSIQNFSIPKVFARKNPS